MSDLRPDSIKLRPYYESFPFWMIMAGTGLAVVVIIWLWAVKA